MPNDKRQAPPLKKYNHINRFIWIFLLALLIYYLFTYDRKPVTVELPYSTFKSQVQTGNIDEITMKNSKIFGTFVDRYFRVDDDGDTLSYSRFKTVKPEIPDDELLPLLEKNQVEINAKVEESGWIQTALLILLPWILIIGLFYLISKRARQNSKGFMGGNVFGMGKSRAKKYQQTSSQLTFDDVAGLKNPKKDLREIIDYLKAPKKFLQLGASIPKGILMVGPPGTGKTMLAKAVAGEAAVPFFSISGSEFIEMFVGVGASRVRDMFERAKKEAPSIIFIDEIDSIGRARGTGLGGGHDEREQTLNQILNEMDGFEEYQAVVVMAATNRPDVLDPALTRPGRFDRQITLDLPQMKARMKILQIYTREKPLADDVDLESLAKRSVGFSGADLKNLANEAALYAGRQNKEIIENEDFEQARDKILLGYEREEAITESEKELIAYHEAGHALLAGLLSKADPLQKVTIIPRGRSLGATEQIPEEEKHNLSKTYLLERLTVMLGGRASEKIVFNDLSNGAAEDLKRVTGLVRKMVCQWGMSEELGAMTFRQGEEHMFLGREIAQNKDFSEQTAHLIDQEVGRIIGEAEEQAIQHLESNRRKLDKLARALLEQETLEKDEIDRILKD